MYACRVEGTTATSTRVPKVRVEREIASDMCAASNPRVGGHHVAGAMFDVAGSGTRDNNRHEHSKKRLGMSHHDGSRTTRVEVWQWPSHVEKQ
jgi:hypothetical protein